MCRVEVQSRKGRSLTVMSGSRRALRSSSSGILAGPRGRAGVQLIGPPLTPQRFWALWKRSQQPGMPSSLDARLTEVPTPSQS